MATAAKKITLSASRDIPFNKLILSQSNVRRIKAGTSIEELAEDIAHRGLLQNLKVRPVVDGDGKETGMFEVPAGGRRYRALELLTEKKRFGTFQTFPEQGMSEEDIAARFFVSVNTVKQRLKLAMVSEKLLDLYAEDAMTLEQLMAFIVSTDHARQEQVWEAIEHSWSKEPYQIRRMLTENTVRASDRRVRFVTIEAYEEAGGTVVRDLFQDDDGGWIEDVALLERLVGEKLTAEADTIAEEGWKWISVASDFPYGHTNGLRTLTGTPVDLTDEVPGEVDELARRNRGSSRRIRGPPEAIRSCRDRPRRRFRQHPSRWAAFGRPRLCPARGRGPGGRGSGNGR